MVNKNEINNCIDKSILVHNLNKVILDNIKIYDDYHYDLIELLKCHDYPKAIALQNFNAKDYKEEKYPKGVSKRDSPSPVGPLQQKQEDLQDDVNYSNDEKQVYSSYTIGSFWAFVAWFYKEDYMPGYPNWWKREIYEMDWGTSLAEERSGVPHRDDKISNRLKVFGGHVEGTKGHTVPEMVEIMDNIIDKSPPLQENTVLWRYGHWDNLQVGEHGVWKSYSSTSFNSYVAKSKLRGVGFNPDKNRYKIKIYAPKGTKGVVPYGGNGCEDWQSEFTLGRGQKYIVLNVDDVNKTAEVLLY